MTSIDQQFPLPLTDFEHYAFGDDSRQHPMVIPLRIQIEGPLDLECFLEALDQALDGNPLLRSVVDTSGWRLHWKPVKDFTPKIDCIESSDDFPSTSCPPRWIDLCNETGVQFELRRSRERSVLVSYFHHACTDGIGAIRFLGDVFAIYGNATAAPGQEPPEIRTIEPAALLKRGTTKMPGDCRGRRAPVLHTLMETFRLFRRRSYRFRKQPPSSQPQANRAIPNIILTRVLPRQVLRQLKRAAAENGVTTNDLFMMVFLEEIEKWEAGNTSRRSHDLFRVLMPVSMRNPEHDGISAANVVSYVFHSYRRDEVTASQTLLSKVHQKSHQMVNRNEGAAMLHGFRIARLIPGLFRLSRRMQPDFASAVMTNVGEVRRLFENRFPLHQGRAVAGNVVIHSVDGVAPVRENTNLTMAFGTYGGELIIHVNRNARLFSEADAESLLQSLADRLVSLAEFPSQLAIGSRSVTHDESAFEDSSSDDASKVHAP